MPILEIDFDMYCGICGNGVCNDTEVSNETKYSRASLKLTCSYCQKTISDLEKDIEKLELELKNR